jgi:hypothetical protein
MTSEYEGNDAQDGVAVSQQVTNAPSVIILVSESFPLGNMFRFRVLEPHGVVLNSEPRDACRAAKPKLAGGLVPNLSAACGVLLGPPQGSKSALFAGRGCKLF